MAKPNPEQIEMMRQRGYITPTEAAERLKMDLHYLQKLSRIRKVKNKDGHKVTVPPSINAVRMNSFIFLDVASLIAFFDRNAIKNGQQGMAAELLCVQCAPPIPTPMPQAAPALPVQGLAGRPMVKPALLIPRR